MKKEIGRYAGGRMFDILIEQGGTLTLLAKQSGTDLSQISRMRKGERPIPQRVVDAAVRILNMPESELFTDALPRYEERFWNKVDKSASGCWLWRGYIDPNGSPRCSFLGEMRPPSCVAWEISNQPIPEQSRLVRMCENQACVNPDHHDLEPILTSEQYFWVNVQPDPESGCWHWQGYTYEPGYGRMGVKPYDYAHRFAYQHFVGPIPRRRWILHHCDNPSCVNPEHLYAGTAKDNALDRERRGRGGGPKLRGDNSSNAILNESQVREIKRLKGTVSARVLAERFGVSQSAIYSIYGGYSWSHVQIDEAAA